MMTPFDAEWLEYDDDVRPTLNSQGPPRSSTGKEAARRDGRMRSEQLGGGAAGDRDAEMSQSAPAKTTDDADLSTDLVLRGDDPGPHMTAVQLEWSAREIERLRAALSMLWTYYLLPISDEQKAQVQAALGESSE